MENWICFVPHTFSRCVKQTHRNGPLFLAGQFAISITDRDSEGRRASERASPFSRQLPLWSSAKCSQTVLLHIRPPPALQWMSNARFSIRLATTSILFALILWARDSHILQEDHFEPFFSFEKHKSSQLWNIFQWTVFYRSLWIIKVDFHQNLVKFQYGRFNESFFFVSFQFSIDQKETFNLP